MANDPIQICFSVPQGNVVITENDSNPAPLSDKLVAGTGITLTILNPGGDEQILISSTGGGSGSGNVYLSITDFDYTTSNPLFLQLVTLGQFVYEARLSIVQAFDGTVTLSIGLPGQVTRLMATNENDPLEIADYASWPGFTAEGDDTIYLYLSVTSSTMGIGKVEVFSRPL